MSVLLLLAVFVLILLNGFFVASEFALVRTRRGRLEELQREKPSKAVRTALLLLDDLSEYLSACQFGITLTSLASASWASRRSPSCSSRRSAASSPTASPSSWR